MTKNTLKKRKKIKKTKKRKKRRKKLFKVKIENRKNLIISI